MSTQANPAPVVLIVDDEPVNIKILSNLLLPEYDIRVATSGEKCIEIAEGDDKPDLILLDINLPGIDGYEVCRHLKENAETRKIAIIFISGRTEESDEEKGFRMGASDYIVKPFSPIVIAARVRNQINLKLRTDELEKMASTDSLTGLASRRAYDEQLTRLWNHCMRERQPFSVIMADIDFFKAYNDFYGHGAGDVCLRRVARVFLEIPERSMDVVARYGGEEFAIILPNTDIHAATQLAEQIRTAIYGLAIPHQKSLVSSLVTVSLGCACVIAEKGQDPVNLVGKADAALYEAKQGGRNQVRAAPDGKR